MRKDVMKVLKEGQDIDMVKDKDPRKRFGILKWLLDLKHLQQCGYIAILLNFSYTATKMMLQQLS